ncbi:hypothetical protein DITRI_Ditri10aG0122600 [Diplodiscus trichospermus]
MASQRLTKYERKRLENIKRNAEMVAALKIHSATATLSATAKRQRAKTYKVSPMKKPKPEIPVVIRRSFRTKGISPDSKGLADNFCDNFDKKPKYVSPLKPQSPKNQVALSVKEEFNGVKDVKEENLSDFIEKGKLKSYKSEVLECPDERLKIKEELDENLSGKSKFVSFGLAKGVVENEYLDDLVKIQKSDFYLESLDLKPENIARLLSERIMVIKFFPCSSTRMITMGSKFGNIAFWNVDCEDEKEDGIYLYRSHLAPIFEISIQQYSMSKIFTSCYDGFIRLMDVEKEVFDLVHSCDDGIFSLTQQPNNLTSLYFGERSEGLNMWDIRVGKPSKKWMLHEYRINTIDFNP